MRFGSWVAAMLWVLMLSACTVNLTIYDDGRSCPGGCDAHVVFHPSMNGTWQAHDPKSRLGAFRECKVGELCELCLARGQCIQVTYRGAGPPPRTFDFTPAFYADWCPKPNKPEALSATCAEFDRSARRLEGRINCIKNPDDKACSKLIASVRSSKRADQAAFERCQALGEASYNQTVAEADRRIYDCAYSKQKRGGPNVNGLTWHELLPAACRDGTFVGRDGLDCCSGNRYADAALGVECRHFYPPAEAAKDG